MNREILFRGKADMDEVDLSEMNIPHEKGWVTGNFVYSKGSYYIIGEIEDVTEEYFQPSFWIPVIPSTVGQFTGLTDKNGTKIFEGDMAQIKSYGECIITFNTSICAFQYAYYAIGEGTAIGGRMSNTLFNSDTHRYEITSNIHDNPTT